MARHAILDDRSLSQLDDQLRGPLVLPPDERYDDARGVYNAMIDKRPAAVAYCVDAADVMRGVKFAAESDTPLAVRGGAHSGPGYGTCDDGVVLDLSRMNGVRIDPGRRTARVEGGCRFGDVDHATHAFGLATPSGIISTTGVGGLTLGGGHGYLSRRYGLTVDNLISADVVLANGSFVTANEKEHPDLFWALRGGGGNFGVVTSFEFRLHPVETVFAGPTLWPVERTADALRWYDAFMRDAPDDVYGFFAILEVPPAPMFPESLHHEKMCGVVWCCLGKESEAEAALEPIKDFEEPAFQHTASMPYPMLQSLFDPLYPSGLQWYWKGHFVRELNEPAVDAHARFAAELPSMLSTMHLYPVDGAVHRVGARETAFHHRDARWSQVIVGVDPDPTNADRVTDWTREYWEALRPHTKSGGYLNFMMDEGEERVRATYGENYDRLARVKQEYDPENLFRVNQNIAPSG